MMKCSPSRLNLLLGACAACLCVLAFMPSLSIADDLGIGTAHGVKIEKASTRRGFVIKFTPAAAKHYRKIAGHNVTLECSTVDKPDGPFSTSDSASIFPVHASKRRRPMDSGLNGSFDYCTVKRHADIVTVPLTQAGLADVSARETADELTGVVALANLIGGGEHFAAGEVVAQTLSAHGGKAQALTAPGQQPDPGFLGIYTDSGTHVYVAKQTVTGELLFFEWNAGVVTTNMLRWIVDRG